MTDASAIQRLREQVEAGLKAYDAFMSGGPVTETSRAICTASAFAAEAFMRSGGGAEGHALARAFLLALIDPSSEELDHLRTDPASGKVAREAAARLRALEAREGGE